MNDEILTKMLGEAHGLLNFHRRMDFDDHWLLSTDHGSWIKIDKEDYEEILEKDYRGKHFDDLVERGFILTSETVNDVVDAYRLRYRMLDRGPSLHIIVPTIRCNLRCVYCHSEAEPMTRGPQFDMSEETLKKVLHFIFQTPKDRIRIEFQGGEPMLNKKIIKKTLQFAQELALKTNKRFNIALVSNFTQLDDDMLEFLVKHKELLSISTSLDGPQELHDQNRCFLNNGAGTYDNVTRNIERCQEKGLHVGLLMVTTRYSLPYWKEIVDEYVRWGQKGIHVKLLDRVGYAAEVWDEIGYSMDEYVSFWKKVNNYSFELFDKGIMIFDRFFKLALKKILYSSDPDYLDWMSPCGTLRGQVVYNHNGDIYCCDEARVSENFIVGNVFESTYASLLEKDKTQEIIKSSMLEGYYCDSCFFKPYCGVCPIIHHCREGNYRIKLNKTNNCQFYRSILDFIFRKLMFNTKEVKKIMLALSLLKSSRN